MGRARIVLADDHQDFRTCVAALLQPHFELVASVSDGQALIEAADEHNPDLVLLDISMPVLSGFEALRRLKGAASRAKVIFVTVHEDQDFVSQAFSLGANGYVVKSQLASDLVKASREVLAGRNFVPTTIK